MNNKIHKLIIDSGIVVAEGFYAVKSGELRGNDLLVYQEAASLETLVRKVVAECISVCDETESEYCRNRESDHIAGIDAVRRKLSKIFEAK